MIPARALRILLLLLLGGLCALMLRHHLLVLAHPYPLEYGEGVNQLWISRIATGQPLYPPVNPDALPQLHNPYPPLAPLLAHGLSRLLPSPHPFFAGRLLMLLGSLLSAKALFRLLRRQGLSPAHALLPALLFLLSPMLLRFGSLLRYDPLALGLSLQALALLDRPLRPRHAALAALLGMSALLVKHTLIAVPILLILLCIRPFRVRLFLAAALGAALPLGAVALWLFHRESPQLLLHLWNLQGLPSDLDNVLAWLAPAAGFHAPLLALAIAALRIKNPGTQTLRLYALLACIAPLLTSSITGSQENYLLELWAAACLLAGLGSRSLSATALGPVLLLQLLLFIPFPAAPVFTRTYGQELPAAVRTSATPTAADSEIGRLLHMELRTADAPILSSDLGHLAVLDRAPVFQPYQYGHLARAGKWNLHALDTAIREHAFAFVLLKGLAETHGDPYFPPAQQDLIHQHYELHRVLGPWHLYRRVD
jgi:hypothetical protein